MDKHDADCRIYTGKICSCGFEVLYQGRLNQAFVTQIDRLRAENAELKQRNADWLKENGPGGWIDNMRQRITELEALLQEAWADHIRLPYGASHEDVTTFRDFEKRFRALSGGGG